MTFQVRQTRRASRDVDNIFNWIANIRRAPQGAASWRRAYQDAVARLARDPEAFPLAFEADDLGVDLREFTFKTRQGHVYRGVFIVDGDVVLILRVRGSGQGDLEPHDLGLPDLN